MTTRDGYAQAIIREGQSARTTGPDYLQHPVITPRGITIALATGLVEANLRMYANESDPDSLNYPHDAVSSDANSDGIFQQRAPWWGTVADRMDAAKSAAMFYHHLAGLDYNNPARTPGSYAQQVQQSAYPDRYDQRMPDALDLYTRLAPTVPTTPAPPAAVAAPHPDFNEYPRWCDNSNDRGGAKVDLWLIHTQEGAGNADQLASFLISTTGGPNPVSYHYTISQDVQDGGVTVCDVVDTDQACWAVGDANNRSINLCFAGSSINWSTDQWMQQSKAIDVAGYLCAQDALKYGFPPTVIVPPYLADPPGVSDHKYVTQHLGWGTHTDVGFNYPWPYFQQRVAYWAQALSTGAAPPAALPDHPVVPYDPTQNAALEALAQLRGRWGMLGGQTMIEALAEIRDKVLNTNDRHADAGGFQGW